MSVPTPYSVSGEQTEYMYKKTLGVAYENPGAAPAQENISSLPYIFNNQIIPNNISAIAPNLVSSSVEAGGIKWTTDASYIFFYQYLPLSVNNASQNVAFVNNGDLTQNLTTQSIPSTYDPAGSYKITIYNRNTLNNSFNEVASNSNMPWIFDTTTGCVTFINQQWTSVYNTSTGFDPYPYISFYRYEGLFGISGAESSSKWTTSGDNIYNNNTGYVGIGTINPSSTLDVSGNVHISKNLDLSGNLSTSQGITGPTGSFTYLSASQGITGPTGSFSYLYSTDNTYLATNSGNVTIGTSETINSRLYVKGTNTFRSDSSNNQFFNLYGSNLENHLSLRSVSGSARYLWQVNRYSGDPNTTKMTFRNNNSNGTEVDLNLSGDDASFGQKIIASAGITGPTGSFTYLTTSNDVFIGKTTYSGLTGTTLYVGSDNSNTGTGAFGGKIVFGGTNGDAGPEFRTAQITKRLLSADLSELFIYNGNDNNGLNKDRIRLRSGKISFDVYPNSDISNDSGIYTENIICSIDNTGITGSNGSFTNLYSSNNSYLSTTSGNVGIGTYNPIHKLDVSGNMYISTNLDVSGNVNISGNLTALTCTTTSDYRMKKDIRNIDEGFNIDNLNPVIYKLKNNDQIQTGFIAHELQEYYPFLVNGIKDGTTMQSINYSGLIPILVREIQQLKKEINELKTNKNI